MGQVALSYQLGVALHKSVTYYSKKLTVKSGEGPVTPSGDRHLIAPRAESVHATAAANEVMRSLLNGMVHDHTHVRMGRIAQ